MTYDLTDRVAIITGGSRGIGRAIALAFAEAGARVVVASRKQEGVDAVAAEIESRGGTALAIAAHMGQEATVVALVEQTVETFGGVDIVINNAATNPHFGPILSATSALWDKILEVNLRGAFYLCQQVAPIMEERGGGVIINMVSTAGIRPSLGLGIYSVSKAGLIMMTKVLAMELGPSKIRVNAIAPGVIKTQFSRALWESDAIAQAVRDATPLGRLGEPGDIVGAALFLASPLSDYVNGEILVIDGGMRISGGMG
ncbi:MAG TPA: SDR family oxidoreductase [Anaerolineae bacterium]|nr:SDR family oxidoreductase [Anaerolineae bacterium]